jgi:hypothetical protein
MAQISSWEANNYLVGHEIQSLLLRKPKFVHPANNTWLDAAG